MFKVDVTAKIIRVITLVMYYYYHYYLPSPSLLLLLLLLLLLVLHLASCPSYDCHDFHILFNWNSVSIDSNPY